MRQLLAKDAQLLRPRLSQGLFCLPETFVGSKQMSASQHFHWKVISSLLSDTFDRFSIQTIRNTHSVHTLPELVFSENKLPPFAFLHLPKCIWSWLNSWYEYPQWLCATGWKLCLGIYVFCGIGPLCRLNYRLWRKTTICVCVTFKCQSKATRVCEAERPAWSQRTEKSGTVDLFVHNKQTQLWHHEHLFVRLGG